jgi:outer membrane biogenesis lipoprotein LolB
LKNLIKLVFTVISLVYFFSGCSSSTDNTSSSNYNDVEILPADRLIKRIEANRRKIKTFEGTGTITIKTPDFNNSASFKLDMIKPDSVYLVVMGPFNMELANIIVTNREFTFYDVLNNTAYKGYVNQNVLRDIFKIDISLDDLMDAFIGSVNLSDELYREPENFKIDNDKYILTFSVPTTKQLKTISVDIKDLGILTYNLNNADGKTLINGVYSNFSSVDGVATPNKIYFENPVKNQSIQIEYKNITANKKDIFIDFQLPADATVIKW